MIKQMLYVVYQQTDSAENPMDLMDESDAIPGIGVKILCYIKNIDRASGALEHYVIAYGQKMTGRESMAEKDWLIPSDVTGVGFEVVWEDLGSGSRDVLTQMVDPEPFKDISSIAVMRDGEMISRFAIQAVFEYIDDYMEEYTRADAELDAHVRCAQLKFKTTPPGPYKVPKPTMETPEIPGFLKSEQ